MFEAFRVPTPSNISRELSRLRSHSPALVTSRTASGRWSLTPAGKGVAEDTVGHLDSDQIEAELVSSNSADFAQVRHLVIPPMFAPPRWSLGISALLDRHPFETNVFLMTRYPGTRVDNSLDPIADAISVIRNELKNHGLTAHLASDRQAEDHLFGNIAAHIWACRYGIGLLEDRVKEGINDNVILELGAMLMTGRRCALLKDKALDRENIPSDLVGHIYKSVDFDDLDSVRSAISKWATDDLGIGKMTSADSST